MESNYRTRHRINVSTTSKGIKSYDVTVEMTDASKEQVLAESDALVCELDKRYPPQEVK